jgi:hypothetical protein
MRKSLAALAQSLLAEQYRQSLSDAAGKAAGDKAGSAAQTLPIDIQP